MADSENTETKEIPALSDTELQCDDIINGYLGWSAGAGLIPFAFIDVAALTVVQVKMISEISEVYEVPFKEEQVQAIISALIGSVVPAAAAGTVSSFIKLIPIVGTIAGAFSMSALAVASTWALGKLFTQHFEKGGTIYDLDPEKVQEAFSSLFKEGKAQHDKKDGGTNEGNSK